MKIASNYYFIPLLFFIISFSVSAATPIFGKDLYYGLKNDVDVQMLQQFLTDKGFYSGPINGNFYSLTREAVRNFQIKNNITPALGYFGIKTRTTLNQPMTIREIFAPPKPLTIDQQIKNFLDQVKESQKQSLITAKEKSMQKIQSLPIIIPEIVLPNPFPSSLRIEVTYPSTTLSRLTDVTLTEFKISNGERKSNNKVAITKIRFTNLGTLADENFIGLKLIDSRSERVIADGGVVPQNGIIEFLMTPDQSKPDNGLLVSGGLYSIIASLKNPNTGLKPTIRFDIMEASDIAAFDYNDLTRVADITAANLFPITGPTITLP